MKKIFLVPVAYEMYGRVEVEAESAEEAIKKAEEEQDYLPLPNDASYLDGSFVIDSEGIVLNEDGTIANI